MNLTPCVALVVYSDAHVQQHLLSLHGISKSPKGHPMLDAGRLLGAADAAELAALLTSKAEAKRALEFFPENLLHADAFSMTWYRPPTMTTQFWRTQQGRRIIRAVLPGLVFHARDRALYVAAVEGNARPHPHSQVYHAPLGNVNANTSVCLGNVPTPESATPNTIGRWEDVLLSSNYTHINHQQVLRAGATNESFLAFWSGRQRSKSPPSEKLLAPLKLSLAGWIERIHEGVRRNA